MTLKHNIIMQLSRTCRGAASQNPAARMQREKRTCVDSSMYWMTSRIWGASSAGCSCSMCTRPAHTARRTARLGSVASRNSPARLVRPVAQLHQVGTSASFPTRQVGMLVPGWSRRGPTASSYGQRMQSTSRCRHECKTSKFLHSDRIVASPPDECNRRLLCMHMLGGNRHSQNDHARYASADEHF